MSKLCKLLLLSMVFTLTLSFFMPTTGVMAEEIKIDGTSVPYTNNSGYPYITNNGILMAPIRITMDVFGAVTNWDNETNSAVISMGTKEVRVPMNQNYVVINGNKVNIPASGVNTNGIAYMPVHTVIQGLGGLITGSSSSLVIDSQSQNNYFYNIENREVLSSYDLWNVYWPKANNAMDSHDYAGAVSNYERVLATFVKSQDYTNSALVYLKLGQAYVSLQDFQKAAAAFSRESYYWEKVNQRDSALVAKDKATSAGTDISLYLKTNNMKKSLVSNFGVGHEPARGIIFGSYDVSVSQPNKEQGIVLQYLTYGSSLSPQTKSYAQSGKVVELAVQPMDGLGSLNDAATIALAKDVNSTNGRFLVRFANEMNLPNCEWYTSDPSQYINAFRNFVNIFRQYAPGTPIVWAPSFFPSHNINDYYPGDEYVDYVGVSSYIFSQNYSAEEISAGKDMNGDNLREVRWSQQLDFIYNNYGYKKPIIIAEGGASYIDQNTRTNITPFAAYQIQDMYTYLPLKYPNLKYAVYFNASNRSQDLVTQFLLSSSPALTQAYAQGVKDNYYISTLNQADSINYCYVPISSFSEANKVPAEKQQLCSYVKYVNDQAVKEVRYLVSGISVGAATEIPYAVDCDFSEFAGEDVVITVEARDGSGSLLSVKKFNCKVEGSCPSFSDISGTAWYAHYVYDLAKKDILNGKGNGAFCPQDNITRAEFAKILAFASGDDLNQYEGKTSFNDVVTGKWLSNPIEWACQNGIVQGKGDGVYAPNDNISRQDMAVMIVRYAEYKGKTLPESNPSIVFADDAEIGGWAKEAVYAMQKAGIINGKGDNLFAPRDSATRAEASKMISVFLSL